MPRIQLVRTQAGGVLNPQNNNDKIVVVRMTETDEESSRKKTPRELVEMAYRLEKEEEEKEDFFSGIRNFFGSMFSGGSTARHEQKNEPKEDTTIASTSSENATASSFGTDEGKAESRPTGSNEELASTTLDVMSIVEEEPASNSVSDVMSIVEEEPASNPVSDVVSIVEEEPASNPVSDVMPVVEEEPARNTSEPAEAVAVIESASSEAVEPPEAKAVGYPAGVIPDELASGDELLVQSKDPDNESKTPELTSENTSGKRPDVAGIEKPLTEPIEDELSDEDMIAMIELAQGSVPEGRIAGLDDFLATATATVEPPPSPPPVPKPTKPAFDMDKVAEMARRAVEEYERSLADKEENSPEFPSESQQQGVSEDDNNPVEEKSESNREAATPVTPKPTFVTLPNESMSKQQQGVSKDNIYPVEKESESIGEAAVQETPKPAFVARHSDSISKQQDAMEDDLTTKKVIVTSTADEESEPTGESDVQSKPKPAFVMQLDDTAVVDWSGMTVSQLKSELDSRNLKKSGKKADLIARLEAHTDSSMEKVAMETPEVSNHSAEAAKRHDSREDVKEFSSMTIKELKDELKRRNLTLSGKKVELISRLEEYEAASSTGGKDMKVGSLQSPLEVQEDSPTSFKASDIESDDSPNDLEERTGGPRNGSSKKGEKPSGTNGPDYRAMTLKQLKDELRSRGVPVSGKKSVLIDRLYDNDSFSRKSVDSPTKVMENSVTNEEQSFMSGDTEAIKKTASLKSGSEQFVPNFAVHDVVSKRSDTEDLTAEAFESVVAETTVLVQADPLRSKVNPLLSRKSNGVQPSGGGDKSSTFVDLAEEFRFDTDRIKSNGFSDGARLREEASGEKYNSNSVEEIYVGDFVVDKSLPAGQANVRIASDSNMEQVQTEAVPPSLDDQLSIDDFVTENSILKESAEDESNAETLDEYTLDSSMLEELAAEAREDVPETSSPAIGNYVEDEIVAEPMEDFDLDEFALDSSMLEELAEEAREDVIQKASEYAEPAVDINAEAESMVEPMEGYNLDEFALDSSMLEDLAEEARRDIFPKTSVDAESAADNTTDNEDIAEPTEDFDLDDFALDSSILDDLAKEARRDLTSKTNMPDSMISLDDFTFDAEALGEIAEQARQTVDEAVVSSTFNPTEDSGDRFSMRDWSKVPLVALRSELEARGLPSDGARMSLVAALEVSDLDRFDESNGNVDNDDGTLLDDYGLGNLDMNELSKAARDAQLMFEEDDEPSDEALRAIENELERELASSSSKQGEKSLDYESMAVSQLKKELKSRNLRVTGKKVDLIARLKESD